MLRIKHVEISIAKSNWHDLVFSEVAKMGREMKDFQNAECNSSFFVNIKGWLVVASFT
jgi:hypothetical protein